MSSTLERDGDQALVLEASTGPLARLNLTVAAQVPLQKLNVLVVDFGHFLGAKPTDLFAIKISHLTPILSFRHFVIACLPVGRIIYLGDLSIGY